MDRPDEEAIQMFMSITASSRPIAVQMLLDHSGNLNGAVNAHFSEGNRNLTCVSSIAEVEDDLMDIDDPTQDESFTVLPSARTMNPFSLLESDFSERRAYGSGADLSSTAQLVSHPREAREIPGVVVDDTKQAGHSGRTPTIEDSTGTANQRSSEIDDIVIIDENDKNDILEPPVARVGPTFAQALASGPSAPRMDELADYRNDIEEEMVRAAIEASKKDSEICYPEQNTSLSPQRESYSEDPELAQAVSLSLKTAEERSVQNLGEKVGTSELEDMKSSKIENLHRLANGRLEVGGSSTKNEDEDIEDQPLVRHRRSRQMSAGSVDSDTEFQDTKVGSSSNPQKDTGSGDPQHNETDIGLDEWGGISSLEHDEAVMLEAALFGGISERSEYHVPYVPHQYMQNGLDRTRGYRSGVPRPPSPSLTAQRLIREQQDDDYLASLQTDREKELKAREEERQKEEELHKKLQEEQELERQLAAKEASLPPDPSSYDENAVSLLVRMPDGSRRGRRFLKSHKLQYLFDFIDVGRQVKPASYRLVRPYPRRAFGDEERAVTFNELGLVKVITNPSHQPC